MDVNDVYDRGRAIGLNPPRMSTTLHVSPHKRQWQHVQASRVKENDLWAEHGVVKAVHHDEATVYLLAGASIVPVMLKATDEVFVFTEVENDGG